MLFWLVNVSFLKSLFCKLININLKKINWINVLIYYLYLYKINLKFVRTYGKSLCTPRYIIIKRQFNLKKETFQRN